MLRHLALHHDYLSILVQDGYYLEALRYAQKNKVSCFLFQLRVEEDCVDNKIAFVLIFIETKLARTNETWCKPTMPIFKVNHIK